jgi:threonine synthase
MPLPTSRLQHLECSACQAEQDWRQLHNLCSCGAPFLARYALDASVPRPDARITGMWRHAALMPHLGEAITLGEGDSPVLPLPRLGAALQLPRLFAKDESRNPNTSFKARGLSAAVTMAKALGVERMAIPTAGNAGGALATYAARAGLSVDVFMPADTPRAFELEALLHGARVTRVDGLIDDCGRRVAELVAAGTCFDVSTLKEPYRLEGKKTMGYEIFEQMRDAMPDVILYPTGGGTGLIGIAKAFDELRVLGWYDGPTPRLVAVQSEGCAPMVRAFESGKPSAERWENASTEALGLRVPGAVGDRLILQAVRESGGTAIAVGESALLAGMRQIASQEGIPAGPEVGALVAAAADLLASGWLDPAWRVLLLCTGSAHKYPTAIEAAL